MHPFLSSRSFLPLVQQGPHFRALRLRMHCSRNRRRSFRSCSHNHCCSNRRDGGDVHSRCCSCSRNRTTSLHNRKTSLPWLRRRSPCALHSRKKCRRYRCCHGCRRRTNRRGCRSCRGYRRRWPAIRDRPERRPLPPIPVPIAIHCASSKYLQTHGQKIGTINRSGNCAMDDQRGPAIVLAVAALSRSSVCWTLGACIVRCRNRRILLSSQTS